MDEQEKYKFLTNIMKEAVLIATYGCPNNEKYNKTELNSIKKKKVRNPVEW